MLIKVNGEEEEIEVGLSILEYIKYKSIDPNQVVIQYNGEIIGDDERLSQITLQPKDILEILRFVGGG
ncbi:sulfur carrier protein ThiS [Selenihalanaerobacter shriftii]|uniref:Sulfur carrier protein n=1 Tax=Selenihalanaerobacter shriftii TaxID=142842 RepID=A0A1T4LC81_9FIRM|nr:sulfur carrier protein ThiS [Selenihalanaerobacter shriftii]SJZ52295.1 sulfur carrier protein [Selenihalanaerobacter shriftii]